MEKKEQELQTLPLPPGNLDWPWIGETIPFLKNINKFAEQRFQKYADIFKTQILGQTFIYIKGAEANRYFLTAKNIEPNFPSSLQKLSGCSIANQTGDIHKSRRQIIAQSFKPRNLEAYFDEIVIISQQYLEKWHTQRELTWYPELKNYTFDVAAKFLIGLERASQTPLRTWFDTYEEGLFSVTLQLPWTKFGRAMKSRQLLLIEIEKIIKQRQLETNANSDSLSILLEAKDEKGEHLSGEELKDQILNLLFAGHGTLTSALTSFCLLIAQHPDVLTKVKEEQNKFSVFSQETIRAISYYWAGSQYCSVNRKFLVKAAREPRSRVRL